MPNVIENNSPKKAEEPMPQKILKKYKPNPSLVSYQVSLWVTPNPTRPIL